MTTYTPPLDDIRQALDLVDMPLEADIRDAVLDEAGKLAAEVIAPTNRAGDTVGARFDNGAVVTAPGFKAAYQALQQAGWCGAPFSPDHGGGGLPRPLCFALQEMWTSANMAFSLCPLLTQGAVEIISARGTEAQKSLWLEKLTTGVWTGTMLLTEPQAGSDVGAVRTRAVRGGDGEGTYRLTGQKIFITYGEHDLAENIIHMVLARVEGAPDGVKGLSLFAVPKILPDGTRNDIVAVGLEHKLGLHGSPTATMALGENGGATGFLIGAEHTGMDAMFLMMNAARLGVGLEGLAIAERARQQAVAYAQTRIQSRDLRDPKGPPVPIIRHPDVRRMLLTLRAYTEAMRGLAYTAGAALEAARGGDAAAQARVDLLTPVVKAWCTDLGVECASLALQVQGGMGYIEETGAAQHYRDARIAQIYEGTNGIQANDLVFRKVQRDKGAAALAFIHVCREQAPATAPALAVLERTTAWVVGASPVAAASAATAYLRLFGHVAGAVMLERLALRTPHKRPVADFYHTQLLPPALALADTLDAAEHTTMTLAEDLL